jgi:hypothetical protein
MEYPAGKVEKDPERWQQILSLNNLSKKSSVMFLTEHGIG